MFQAREIDARGCRSVPNLRHLETSQQHPACRAFVLRHLETSNNGMLSSQWNPSCPPARFAHWIFLASSWCHGSTLWEPIQLPTAPRRRTIIYDHCYSWKSQQRKCLMASSLLMFSVLDLPQTLLTVSLCTLSPGPSPFEHWLLRLKVEMDNSKQTCFLPSPVYYELAWTPSLLFELH